MVIELVGALIIAVAFFLQRVTGFGSAVFATPLLALFWNPHETIALVLIFQTIFGFWLIGKVWRSLLEKRLRIFLAVFLPAVIVGAYILPGMSEELVRRALALVTVLVLIQWLFLPGFRLPRRLQPAAAVCCGLFSGIVQGTFGMGGPFFLLYYGNVEGRADSIRDAIIAVFFISNLLRPPIALATAQFTGAVLVAAAVSAAPFIVAMVLGARLSMLINDKVYRIIVSAVLALAAVVLALR